MPTRKMKELRDLKDEDLTGRLAEYRRELLRLRTLSSRGTIAKESGKIKTLKRNVARVETILAEKKGAKE
ncbi:MAG TPA: 50S ribosomal protein L29 [Conexivisphaerales archaeon]|nr:50S ribosomal protein L29 [Conexivisphaerales archaeon]